MITTHVFGTMVKQHFDDSYYDGFEFDFDGQDDHKVEQDIKAKFFEMKKKGFVNVQIMIEDSQVTHEAPELRYGKPYMLGNGGYPTKYIPDMSMEELDFNWGIH